MTPMSLPAIEITSQVLRHWPLPQPGTTDDKEERGRLLIVGGSSEMPGALLLAAEAALRAGAGKLVLLTAERAAMSVAASIPEARVIGLPETRQRGLILQDVQDLSSQFDAVLIGPGLQDESATRLLTQTLLSHVRGRFVLDAMAMSAIDESHSDVPVLLTPHAGEMSHLTGIPKDSICNDPDRVACDWANRWNAIVALKGATTCIAAPSRKLWRHRAENPGLAISGSGDVLAGIIAGLAARGATLEQAAAWGVALHAAAGDALANSIGPLGFLPRELPPLIPALLQELS